MQYAILLIQYFIRKIFYVRFFNKNLCTIEFYFLNFLIMALLIEFLVSGLAVILASYVVPGVDVDTYWTALIVGIVFAIVNLLV